MQFVPSHSQQKFQREANHSNANALISPFSSQWHSFSSSSHALEGTTTTAAPLTFGTTTNARRTVGMNGVTSLSSVSSPTFISPSSEDLLMYSKTPCTAAGVMAKRAATSGPIVRVFPDKVPNSDAKKVKSDVVHTPFAATRVVESGQSAPLSLSLYSNRYLLSCREEQSSSSLLSTPSPSCFSIPFRSGVETKGTGEEGAREETNKADFPLSSPREDVSLSSSSSLHSPLLTKADDTVLPKRHYPATPTTAVLSSLTETTALREGKALPRLSVPLCGPSSLPETNAFRAPHGTEKMTPDVWIPQEEKKKGRFPHENEIQRTDVDREGRGPTWTFVHVLQGEEWRALWQALPEEQLHQCLREDILALLWYGKEKGNPENADLRKSEDDTLPDTSVAPSYAVEVTSAVGDGAVAGNDVTLYFRFEWKEGEAASLLSASSERMDTARTTTSRRSSSSSSSNKNIPPPPPPRCGDDRPDTRDTPDETHDTPWPVGKEKTEATEGEVMAAEKEKNKPVKPSVRPSGQPSPTTAVDAAEMRLRLRLCQFPLLHRLLHHTVRPSTMLPALYASSLALSPFTSSSLDPMEARSPRGDVVPTPPSPSLSDALFSSSSSLIAANLSSSPLLSSIRLGENMANDRTAWDDETGKKSLCVMKSEDGTLSGGEESKRNSSKTRRVSFASEVDIRLFDIHDAVKETDGTKRSLSTCAFVRTSLPLSRASSVSSVSSGSYRPSSSLLSSHPCSFFDRPSSSSENNVAPPLLASSSALGGRTEKGLSHEWDRVCSATPFSGNSVATEALATTPRPSLSGNLTDSNTMTITGGIEHRASSVSAFEGAAEGSSTGWTHYRTTPSTLTSNAHTMDIEAEQDTSHERKGILSGEGEEKDDCTTQSHGKEKEEEVRGEADRILPPPSLSPGIGSDHWDSRTLPSRSPPLLVGDVEEAVTPVVPPVSWKEGDVSWVSPENTVPVDENTMEKDFPILIRGTEEALAVHATQRTSGKAFQEGPSLVGPTCVGEEEKKSEGTADGVAYSREIRLTKPIRKENANRGGEATVRLTSTIPHAKKKGRKGSVQRHAWPSQQGSTHDRNEFIPPPLGAPFESRMAARSIHIHRTPKRTMGNDKKNNHRKAKGNGEAKEGEAEKTESVQPCGGNEKQSNASSLSSSSSSPSGDGCRLSSSSFVMPSSPRTLPSTSHDASVHPILQVAFQAGAGRRSIPSTPSLFPPSVVSGVASTSSLISQGMAPSCSLDSSAFFPVSPSPPWSSTEKKHIPSTANREKEEDGPSSLVHWDPSSTAFRVTTTALSTTGSSSENTKKNLKREKEIVLGGKDTNKDYLGENPSCIPKKKPSSSSSSLTPSSRLLRNRKGVGDRTSLASSTFSAPSSISPQNSGVLLSSHPLSSSAIFVGQPTLASKLETHRHPATPRIRTMEN